MKFSKKRLLKNVEYNKLRKEFFLKPGNEFCKARLPGCFVNATDVHHIESGSDREKSYLDVSTWVPVCRSCHNYIHDKLSTDDRGTMGL